MRIDKTFITTENEKNKSTKVDSKHTASGGKVPQKNAAATTDALVLSPRARDVAEIAQQLREASDVREERVSELKEMIESGTYHVKGIDIAANIVEKAVNKIF